MSQPPPQGAIAEFAEAGALIAAVRAARAAGWSRLDAHAPHPVPEAAEALGARAAPVAWIAVAAGIFGATAAYGTSAMITVRCGVEPPGPSTERCVAVDTGSVSQDWLVTQTDDSWIAVSFGRSPATEVIVPVIRADEAVGEVLAQLSPAAAQADANGLECR